MKIKATHPLQWIADELEMHPSYLKKKMFGCEALCLSGKQVLVIAAKKEPWNGLMVCTFREYHDSLMSDFPSLKPHSILGKWLYISQKNENFEETVQKIIRKVLKGDDRVGV